MWEPTEDSYTGPEYFACLLSLSAAPLGEVFADGIVGIEAVVATGCHMIAEVFAALVAVAENSEGMGSFAVEVAAGCCFEQLD